MLRVTGMGENDGAYRLGVLCERSKKERGRWDFV